MTMRRTTEFVNYIAADGQEYPFHVPSRIGRWLVSDSGWGTPPIQYITQRGPFQDGETVLDFFLRPRTILLLIRQGFCNRDDWWAGRAALLNGIRPNRQSTPTAVLPGQLERIESDGTRRHLDVYIAAGPRFEPRQQGFWDEWSFQEVLRFIAYDPVVFDPTRVDTIFSLAGLTNLVFPITFPITFGSSQVDQTQNVVYVGTWLSYPTIIVTGPLNGLTVTNVTTGEVVALSFNILAGRTVTIDLAYGAKTVVDDLGTNLIGTVTPASDLATWHLAPDPEAAGGVNAIRVQGAGATPGITQVELRYFSRYFGI